MAPCSAQIPRLIQQQHIQSHPTTRPYYTQRPVVDLLVAMVAVPTLILFALQLERNMQSKWAEDVSAKWAVLGLGVGMLVISLLICGYVTHRMGVCLWTGPLEDTSSHRQSTFSHIPSQNDILRIIDTLPPSYESVTKCDIAPPPYDCVVVNIETKEMPAEEPSTTTTPTVPIITEADNNQTTAGTSNHI